MRRRTWGLAVLVAALTVAAWLVIAPFTIDADVRIVTGGDPPPPWPATVGSPTSLRASCPRSGSGAYVHDDGSPLFWTMTSPNPLHPETACARARTDRRVLAAGVALAGLTLGVSLLVRDRRRGADGPEIAPSTHPADDGKPRTPQPAS